MKFDWQFNPGSKIQAPLSYFGDYVISHRTEQYCLRYRPKNQHINLGDYKTLEEAKEAAEKHQNQRF